MVIHKSLDIVDFHSHILPGADHCSGSLETSIWQINSAIRHGVTRIIATPHFYPHRHRVDDFVYKRDEAFYKLEKHIPKGVKIVLGAEVLICQGIENLPDIDKLFSSGTNCLLLCEVQNECGHGRVGVCRHCHKSEYAISAPFLSAKRYARLVKEEERRK